MAYLETMISGFRLSLAIVLFASVCSHAQASDLSTDNPDSSGPGNMSSLYLKVHLDAPLKVSKLKPGDQVPGKLFQDVYSGGAKVFSASSPVLLTVDGLELRRRIPNDHWPWVIKAFTPRHEKWPVFRLASVANADGTEVPLEVTPISVSNEVEVEPKPARNSSFATREALLRHRTRRDLGPLVTLVASTQDNPNSINGTPPPKSVIIPSGTDANIILLRDISATRNHVGDRFQARLVEPVVLDSRILLPEGTLLDGTVLKSQAPRSLSRSGSILLTFTKMTLPGAIGTPIEASVAGAQMNQRSHTVIDPEGRMHGDRPGKAWMLVNIGATGGIAKEADDGAQLIIEALVSTATDASTAGTTRIISSFVSGIFMLTRHGRDVVLPKYTQMKIVFDRPVEISNGMVGSLRSN